jgi:hypothetical protein
LEFLFFIPFVVSLYFVMRKQEDKAFLYVFLPCLLALPDYYAFRPPHLPPFSAAGFALLPLGFGVLFRSIGTWKWRRMDLWFAFYMVSMGLSEILRERDVKDGALLYASSCLTLIPAYIVGRCVVEPHLRLRTVKMIVFILICLTPFILFEFRMGQNPWLIFGNGALRLNVPWSVQLRGGHARVAASFGDTILAGIVFAVVLMFNSWLVMINKSGRLAALGARFAKIEKWHIPGLMLFGFVYLTQSRGPLLSVGVGYLILSIPRFRNMKLAAYVIVALMAIGGAAVYSYFDKYTSVSVDEAVDEKQSSAIYRRIMLEAYKPIVEAGGLLGYGALNHPTVNGQGSIDNAYLLLQLSSGQLGLYTFLLIIGESGWSLIVFAIRFKHREDITFAFCMLGALTAIFFNLTTVYMGEQIPVITFFLVGWSQSLKPQESFGTAPEPAPTRFQFRRVLT